ncbi:formate dehydrogenase accessory sulfurtransferase FdhD [Reinekea thalattae]|uniref:Sulfur carrier protein FdhD n=2 Tax=Reinekea thalattae TaxID=2593301 RepID=A0A5C8ZCT4_9GAMM|nr:formate dehydrogenase accessory sulfurtransferase FdhD [Reinekea thalattae]
MTDPSLQFFGFKHTQYQCVTARGENKKETPLVEEIPFAISINDISYAVLMATPVNLEQLALGFLVSEGIIKELSDIRDIELTQNNLPFVQEAVMESSVVANIQISPRLFNRFKHRQKAHLGASGCGLCGVDSISQAFPSLTKLKPSNAKNADALRALKEQLKPLQTLGNKTGALHAALLLSQDDKPICCMEDIGRHNALDKIIGFALQNKLSLFNHNVLMSSRCSSELVQKAVRAGLSNLTHLASPSTLAVTLANHYGLRLIHLPKREAPRLFSNFND